MLVPPVFAFPEFCEFKPILQPSPQLNRILTIGFVFCLSAFIGCWNELKERSYDAPKTESEFVKGREPQPKRTLPPMMGASSIPLENRRILAAIIPDSGNVYFVKATDRIAKLAEVEPEFRSVVEKFAIDTDSGSPKLELTSGWSMKLVDNANAGIGLAEMIAEINVENAEGKIRFTVSKYDLPRDPSMWDDYLLGQINRWRGQVELPPITVTELKKDLPTVARPGAALPAYLFDASGSDKDKLTVASEVPATSNKTPDAFVASPAMPQLKLVYDKPDGWELQAAQPYREATFKILKEGKEGEVTVSNARGSPIQNAAMWIGQVLPATDPAKMETLATKTVEEAELFEAGTKSGKLYAIRASDQPDARSLLIVSLPMGNDGMSTFVKLNCELRMMEEEKSTFLSFVKSLRWE